MGFEFDIQPCGRRTTETVKPNDNEADAISFTMGNNETGAILIEIRVLSMNLAKLKRQSVVVTMLVMVAMLISNSYVAERDSHLSAFAQGSHTATKIKKTDTKSKAPDAKEEPQSSDADKKAGASRVNKLANLEALFTIVGVIAEFVMLLAGAVSVVWGILSIVRSRALKKGVLLIIVGFIVAVVGTRVPTFLQGCIDIARDPNYFAD